MYWNRPLGSAHVSITIIEGKCIYHRRRFGLQSAAKMGGSNASTEMLERSSSDTTVIQGIRWALRDMRMVIDSLDSSASGELATVLGSFRNYLQQHVVQAGLTLCWQVMDMPSVGQFGPEDYAFITAATRGNYKLYQACTGQCDRDSRGDLLQASGQMRCSTKFPTQRKILVQNNG